MDSKNFESDATTSNTASSSQPDSSWIDRDEPQSENTFLPSAENIEEQLLSLMAITEIISGDCQQDREVELPLTSRSQTTNFDAPSLLDIEPTPAQELETIDLDFDDNLSIAPSDEKTNWFEVACQLEGQNQEFSQSIAELEQALAHSQQQLQIQIERSQDTETILAQQSEELYQNHEQIAELNEQLTVSQQEVKRQQSAIATLLEELDRSQKQVAQLEREYALLQDDCSDRTQKLLAMEKHLRELWSRLHRQQRYTLEYKAALEQFLGMPVEQAMDLELPNPPLAASSIEPWSDRPQHLTILSKNSDGEGESEFIDLDVAVTETSSIVKSPTNSIEPSTSASDGFPSHEISAYSWSKRDRSQVKVDLPSFLRTRRTARMAFEQD